MGANQSSRKITVVNDEAAGVIKLSDSVVQRLKGEVNGEKAASPPPPPPPQSSEPAPPPTADPLPPSPPPVAEAPPPPPPPAEEAAPPQAQHNQYAWQRPIIQYIEEPTLSSLKVKQEKEEEMKGLEDYWKDRLQKQQDEHTAMAKLTTEEFNKSLKKVETLFAKAGTGAVCRDESDAVKGCYTANSDKSLRCRDTVQGFANCVSRARLNG